MVNMHEQGAGVCHEMGRLQCIRDVVLLSRVFSLSTFCSQCGLQVLVLHCLPAAGVSFGSCGLSLGSYAWRGPA